MLEILKFIFSSFWIWAGTMLLIAAASAGFARVVLAMRGTHVD